MWFKTLLIVATLATPTLVSGTIYDCWDREKLQRMSFGSNGKKEDPGLDQFIKMVNCLSSQQGQGSGSNLDHDWRQWSNMAGSGAKYPPGPGWNNPSNPVNQNQWPSNTYNRNPPVQPVPGVPGSIPGVPGAVPGVPGLPNVPGMPGVSGNPGVVGGVGGVGGPGMQPQPGVHPDDWSQRGEGRKRNRNRENRRNKDENRRRLQEETIADLNQPPVGQRYDQATWNNPNPINPLDVPNTFVNPEVETSAVTLSRKYGYAIMALSVVVLAVLMVATIFCCNSSNSTMSQAAGANAAVNQYDSYSIYSYKGGNIPGDTLRSGTLGGYGAETLKSVQSRGSPQYRVSDIDPDFARRFKEHQQY